MGSDWWSRRVGGGQPSQPRPAAPAQPYPQHGYTGYPQSHQPPPGQQPPHPQPTSLEEAMVLAKTGQIESKGGDAAKIGEVHHCPQCGSNNFFTRSNQVKYNASSGQMASAAPTCFDCGYSTHPALSGGQGPGAVSAGVPLNTSAPSQPGGWQG